MNEATQEVAPVETTQEVPQGGSSVEETPTPAETGEQAESQTESTEESATSEGDKPEKNRVQRRIDELTREKYEARRQAEELQAQLVQLQQAQQQQQVDQTINAPPPKLEDYDYDEAQYYQAVQQWNANQIQAVQEQQVKQVEQYQQFQQQQAEAAKFQEKVTRAVEKYPDFMAKINNPEFSRPLSEINPAAYEAVVESDAFADVAYYLANNPAEVYEFGSLSPVQAVKKVALLEAKLATKSTPKQDITPPSEVGGSSQAVTDESKLPTDEWIKRRNEKLNQRK